MPAPLLAVDAPSLLYRAFFALPESIVDDERRPVNALLGCANQVLWAVERHAPRAVALCFGAEAAVYRVELHPGYHADRPPMPAALERQWRLAPALYEAFGWTVIGHDTLEADDLLGSLARIETRAGGDTLVFSGDRDMFQCVSEHVRVLFPGGRDGPTLIDADEVRARYGVEPEQVPDFIALRGDPSDGIPGAKGVGAKTAAELLARHGDLEAAIAHADSERPRIAAALRDDAERLRAYKEVATLVHVPLDRPPDRALDAAAAAAATRELGMSRLADRLAGMA
ncbi:MAG TPA: 5'-3' exonuclease [Solirubrobacteraceae bacterium]|jgi:DNA polymerase-1|nr:5'-3' exonuclease [Solirubrobacteraceae bacterium]